MYLEIIHYYNNALYTNIKSIILAEYYHVHIHTFFTDPLKPKTGSPSDLCLGFGGGWSVGFEA